MPEPRETAPDLLPDVFNAFPMALRKVGDGQPLIDALAEILPAYDAAKEREVRAKVAEEIDEATPPVSIHCSPQEILIAQGMTRARRIALGEQP